MHILLLTLRFEHGVPYKIVEFSSTCALNIVRNLIKVKSAPQSTYVVPPAD